MKKIRQTFVYGLVCLVLCLALSTCFNPLEGSGESSISITIGGSYGARTAVTPNDLRHEIHLSGPQGQEIIEYAGYGETVRIEAELGTWKITVKAYSPGDPGTVLATGEESGYEVRNGQPNAVTIQMHWAAGETFVVTFDTGGGSDVAKQRLLSGSLLDRPDNPTHASLGFVRWCSDDGFTTAFDFDDPVTADITLYTLWSATIYTVSFASNGGSPVAAMTVGDGGTITHPAEPTRAFTQTAGLYRGVPPNQYAFSGWYDGGTLFDFNSPITGDITLDAGWDEPVINVSGQSGGNPSEQAIAYANANPDTYTLLVGGNTSLVPQTLSAANTKLTVRSLGGPYTLNLTSQGSLFTVNANTELTLEDITLQGRANNNAALIMVNNSGKFILNEGGKITGNISSIDGSGVHVRGTFTMSSGEISGNTSSTHGGGVRVGDSGTFTMSGGVISSNTSNGGNGGGVRVGTTGTFTMSGGVISGNTSNIGGGGVYVTDGSVFTMSSGTISGNTVTNGNSGGGVGTNGIFTMNGGTISGNTASGTGNRGGGIYVAANGTFHIANGTIYGSGEASSIRNTASTGASLSVNGTAQRGIFNGSTWTSRGNLVTTNNTIKVANGLLQ